MQIIVIKFAKNFQEISITTNSGQYTQYVNKVKDISKQKEMKLIVHTRHRRKTNNLSQKKLEILSHLTDWHENFLMLRYNKKE